MNPASTSGCGRHLEHRVSHISADQGVVGLVLRFSDIGAANTLELVLRNAQRLLETRFAAQGRAFKRASASLNATFDHRYTELP